MNKKITLAVLLIHLIGFSFLSQTSFKPKPPAKKLVVVTKHYSPPSPVVKQVVEKVVSIQKSSPSPKIKPKKTPKPAPKSPKQVLKKLDKRLTKPVTPQIVQEPAPPSYIDSASLVFREALLLPEKGGVKLTITVQANGKIGKIELETFESKKNLDYLLTVLPTLSLPIPERGNDATFTILFCND